MEVELKDICEFQEGYVNPPQTRHEYFDGNIKWIRATDINSTYIYDTSRTLTDVGFKSAGKSAKLFEPNSLIISKSGTIGKLGIIKDYMCGNRAVINIKPDLSKVNLMYLYYSIKMKLPYIKELARGSVQKNLYIFMLDKVKILLPSLEEQAKMINILEKIDKKVELNNEINNNLHELINQNFSKYLNELDEYIELDIKEIFDFESGVEPGSKNYLEKREENSIKFYRVGDMNSECNTFIKEDLSNGKLIDENDVVVSFDATIGRIGYGLKGAYSTGMKKISINSKYKNIIDNSIVYAYFNSKDVQNIMMENARGTTILHASSSIDFMNFKYNENLLKKYGKLISVAFDKMKSIKNENEKLSKLRDTLLPKLMNGEIDLNNIEI